MRLRDLSDSGHEDTSFRGGAVHRRLPASVNFIVAVGAGRLHDLQDPGQKGNAEPLVLKAGKSADGGTKP